MSVWPFRPLGKLVEVSLPFGAVPQSFRPVLNAMVGTKLFGMKGGEALGAL